MASSFTGMTSELKKRFRILIVDDNSDMAASFAYLLEIMGHEARFIVDPQHAITKVDEFRPDIAFVHIGMVGLDGFGLARWLRNHYARHELRLVAMSVYGDPATRDASMASGFDAYLVKPASAEAVETILGLVFDDRLR